MTQQFHSRLFSPIELRAGPLCVLSDRLPLNFSTTKYCFDPQDRQIGGSCIEIKYAAGNRLILDAGRPLDGPDGATGLLPASMDTCRAATVSIRHPHQDCWGLIDDLPVDWAIWTSRPGSFAIDRCRRDDRL